MTARNDDQAFIARIKTLLDRSTNTLDARTRARLQAARRRAIAQIGAPPIWTLSRWLLPVGVAAALAVVGVIGLWWLQPGAPPSMAATLEDAELLFAADNLDLYQNLDFYRWLAAKERSG